MFRCLFWENSNQRTADRRKWNWAHREFMDSTSSTQDSLRSVMTRKKTKNTDSSLGCGWKTGAGPRTHAFHLEVATRNLRLISENDQKNVAGHGITCMDRKLEPAKTIVHVPGTNFTIMMRKELWETITANLHLVFKRTFSVVKTTAFRGTLCENVGS